MNNLTTGIDEWGTVWVEGYDMGNIFVDRSLTVKMAIDVYLKSLEEVIPPVYLEMKGAL